MVPPPAPQIPPADAPADAQARLEALPRVRLTPLPTPLHRLDRFSEAVGAEVWIKRDDIGSVTLAGNKVRKYELVLGEALALGADTLITTGALQSNSARAGAAAAAQLGLRCILVLTGEPTGERRANLLLDELLGAELRLVGAIGWAELPPLLEAASAAVRAEGGRPYIAPVGASSPLGSLGFALAYLELLAQLDEAGLSGRARLVHTTTSGGTHAGLVVGRAVAGRGPIPVGIDAGLVLAQPQRDLARLANRAGALIGLDHTVDEGAIEVDLGFAGEAYGAITEEAVAAIRLLARTEGIVCDPVYSGKGLAAVVAAGRRSAAEGDGRPIVFWHTGGWHAIFDPHYGDPLT